MKDQMTINLKVLAGLAFGMTLVLVSAFAVKAAHGASGSPANNPYPPHKPAFWAWQNRTDLPANLGQPSNWDNAASVQGWPVGRYPRPRSIAVFEAGVWGAPATGHVAVVEQVYDDGSYLASEMSDNDCRYDSSTCSKVHRTVYPITTGMSFIYTSKDTRTTWSFASGASGWTPQDLSEGYMGGPGWFYPVAGSNPRLVSPELDIPLEGYSGVEVVMAAGIPVSDPSVQVYFATTAQPQFIEARSVKVAGQADGALHTYRLDFSAHAEWKGQLSRLRLDPAGAGSAGGVRIDLIRLIPAAAPPRSSAGFVIYSYLGQSGCGRKSR